MRQISSRRGPNGKWAPPAPACLTTTASSTALQKPVPRTSREHLFLEWRPTPCNLGSGSIWGRTIFWTLPLSVILTPDYFNPRGQKSKYISLPCGALGNVISQPLQRNSGCFNGQWTGTGRECTLQCWGKPCRYHLHVGHGA